MKKINGDGTATYNPVKYQQNSGGNLPLEGTYTHGVEGEEKIPIPINYTGQQTTTQQSTGTSGEVELKGQVNTSTLKQGNAYKVNGKSYIWNGTKLVLMMQTMLNT